MRGAAAIGWLLAFLAGGIWGVAFFSWGLPLPLAERIALTAFIVVALTIASRAGLLAAAAFCLGMGATSSVVIVSSGLGTVEWWALVPVAGLAAGMVLASVARGDAVTRRRFHGVAVSAKKAANIVRTGPFLSRCERPGDRRRPRWSIAPRGENPSPGSRPLSGRR
jgi:hypothetical protein